MNQDIKSFFLEQGYCLIKGVFSKEEIDEIKKSFDLVEKKSIAKNQAIINSGKSFPGLKRRDDQVLILGDLLAFREFKEFDFLIFNKKIVKIVKSLLGDQVCYFGESNMQSGTGDRGFHSDNRISDRNNPSGEDWIGRYPLIRIGLYLNDTRKYSGGVKIMPKSHKVATSNFKKGFIDVPSDIGDIVIWNFTTSHSGNVKKLKIFNNLSIHPRIEDFVPYWLENHNPNKRMGIFFTYGVEGDHLSRYLKYVRNRQDYLKYFRYSGTSNDVKELSIKTGIKIIKPINDYGKSLKPSGYNE